MRVRLRVALEGNAMPVDQKPLRDLDDYELVDIISDDFPDYERARGDVDAKTPAGALKLYYYAERDELTA